MAPPGKVMGPGGAMQIIWLITTTLTLVLSTEATKENMYATTIASVTLYHCEYRKCILID